MARMYEMNLIIRLQDRASARMRRISGDMSAMARHAQAQNKLEKMRVDVQKAQVKQGAALNAIRSIEAKDGATRLKNLAAESSLTSQIARAEASMNKSRKVRGQVVQRAIPHQTREKFIRLETALEREQFIKSKSYNASERAALYQYHALRMRQLGLEVNITEELAAQNRIVQGSIAEQKLLNAEIQRRAALELESNAAANRYRAGRTAAHAGSLAFMGGAVTVGASALAAGEFAQFDVRATKAATQLGSTNLRIGPAIAQTKALTVDLEKRILGLSKAWPATAKEISDSAYNVFSSMDLGNTAAERLSNGMKVLKEANKAAVGGQVDLKTATDTLITVFNDFDPNLGNINKNMAQLFATVRFMRGGFDELSAGMNKLAPAARTAEQSLLETGAAFSVITQAIPSAAQASTAEARLMDLFGSKQFIDGMKRAGAAITKTGRDGQQHLLPLFKILDQIVKVAPELQGGGPKLNQFVKEITQFGSATGKGGSKGLIQMQRALAVLITEHEKHRHILKLSKQDAAEYEKSVAALKDTPDIKMKIAVNNLRVAWIQFGQSAIPVLITLMGAVKSAVDAFNRLPEGTRRMIGVLIVVTGLMATFGGLLLSAFGGIAMVMATRRLSRLAGSLEAVSEAQGGVVATAGKTSSGILAYGKSALKAAGWLGVLILGFETLKGVGDEFTKQKVEGSWWQKGLRGWASQFKTASGFLADFVGQGDQVRSMYDDFFKKFPGLFGKAVKKANQSKLDLADDTTTKKNLKNTGKSRLDQIIKINAANQASEKAAAKARKAYEKSVADWVKRLEKEKTRARQEALKQQQSDVKDAAKNMLAKYRELEDANKAAIGPLLGGPISTGPILGAFKEINDTLLGLGIKPIKVPLQFIMQDAQSQLANFDMWRGALSKLAKKIPPEMLTELRAAGIEKLPEILSLAGAPSKFLASYVKVWKDTKSARDAATKQDFASTLKLWNSYGKDVAWQIVNGMVDSGAEAKLMAGFSKTITTTFAGQLTENMNKAVDEAVKNWLALNPKPTFKKPKVTRPLTPKELSTLEDSKAAAAKAAAPPAYRRPDQGLVSTTDRSNMTRAAKINQANAGSSVADQYFDTGEKFTLAQDVPAGAKIKSGHGGKRWWWNAFRWIPILTKAPDDSYKSGKFQYASGGPVKGTGTGDTVPAMLTPDEVVLNKRHIKNASKLLGTSNTPQAVFDKVDRVQHFAEGGVVKSNYKFRGVPKTFTSRKSALSFLSHSPGYVARQGNYLSRFWPGLMTQLGQGRDTPVQQRFDPETVTKRPEKHGILDVITGGGKLTRIAKRFVKYDLADTAHDLDKALYAGTSLFGGGIHGKTIAKTYYDFFNPNFWKKPGFTGSILTPKEQKEQMSFAEAVMVGKGIYAPGASMRVPGLTRRSAVKLGAKMTARTSRDIFTTGPRQYAFGIRPFTPGMSTVEKMKALDFAKNANLTSAGRTAAQIQTDISQLMSVVKAMTPDIPGDDVVAQAMRLAWKQDPQIVALTEGFIKSGRLQDQAFLLDKHVKDAIEHEQAIEGMRGGLHSKQYTKQQTEKADKIRRDKAAMRRRKAAARVKAKTGPTPEEVQAAKIEKIRILKARLEEIRRAASGEKGSLDISQFLQKPRFMRAPDTPTGRPKPRSRVARTSDSETTKLTNAIVKLREERDSGTLTPEEFRANLDYTKSLQAKIKAMGATTPTKIEPAVEKIVRTPVASEIGDKVANAQATIKRLTRKPVVQTRTGRVIHQELTPAERQEIKDGKLANARHVIFMANLQTTKIVGETSAQAVARIKAGHSPELVEAWKGLREAQIQRDTLLRNEQLDIVLENAVKMRQAAEKAHNIGTNLGYGKVAEGLGIKPSSPEAVRSVVRKFATKSERDVNNRAMKYQGKGRSIMFGSFKPGAKMKRTDELRTAAPGSLQYAMDKALALQSRIDVPLGKPTSKPNKFRLGKYKPRSEEPRDINEKDISDITRLGAALDTESSTHFIDKLGELAGRLMGEESGSLDISQFLKLPKLFHGTSAPFKLPNIDFSKFLSGPVGPGLYTTPERGVAEGYARSRRGALADTGYKPTVQAYTMQAEKMFKHDTTLTPVDVEELAKSFGLLGGDPKLFTGMIDNPQKFGRPLGNRVYNKLEGQFGSREAVNDFLDKTGYDLIRYHHGKTHGTNAGVAYTVLKRGVPKMTEVPVEPFGISSAPTGRQLDLFSDVNKSKVKTILDKLKDETGTLDLKAFTRRKGQRAGGASLMDSLDFGLLRVKPMHEEDILNVLEAIDSVHGIGDPFPKPIPVRAVTQAGMLREYGREYMGLMDYDNEELARTAGNVLRPGSVVLNRSVDPYILPSVFTHELGHVVDYSALKNREYSFQAGTDTAAALITARNYVTQMRALRRKSAQNFLKTREISRPHTQLLDTIMDSPTVRKMTSTPVAKEARLAPEFYQEMVGLGMYDVQPRELFANMYSQWITEKSQHPAMLEYKEWAQEYYDDQLSSWKDWSGKFFPGTKNIVKTGKRILPDEEFGPISKAFDNLFGARGLLRDETGTLNLGEFGLEHPRDAFRNLGNTVRGSKILRMDIAKGLNLIGATHSVPYRMGHAQMGGTNRTGMRYRVPIVPLTNDDTYMGKMWSGTTTDSPELGRMPGRIDVRDARDRFFKGNVDPSYLNMETLIHEVGHALDLTALGARGPGGAGYTYGSSMAGAGRAKQEDMRFGDVPADSFNQLMELITSTTPYEVAREGYGVTKKYISKSWRKDMGKHEGQRRTPYVLDPAEFFARGYTQWIMTNPKATATSQNFFTNLVRDQYKQGTGPSGRLPDYWPTEEFKYLQPHFANLFKNMPHMYDGGWVKGKGGRDNVPTMLTNNEFVLSHAMLRDMTRGSRTSTTTTEHKHETNIHVQAADPSAKAIVDALKPILFSLRHQR